MDGLQKIKSSEQLYSFFSQLAFSFLKLIYHSNVFKSALIRLYKLFQFSIPLE